MGTRIDIVGHAYIAATLAFTVFGQLVLKWQMGSAGQMPTGGMDKLQFLLLQFLNPWILTGLLAALAASVAWMAAMTRLDLSYAYPFMGLAFVIVMPFSVALFGEVLTVQKVVGTLLVVLGLIVMSRA